MGYSPFSRSDFQYIKTFEGNLIFILKLDLRVLATDTKITKSAFLQLKFDINMNSSLIEHWHEMKP